MITPVVNKVYKIKVSDGLSTISATKGIKQSPLSPDWQLQFTTTMVVLVTLRSTGTNRLPLSNKKLKLITRKDDLKAIRDYYNNRLSISIL